MEYITGATAWLKTNWTDILALWACVIGTAEIVVKWTDSKKDDEVIGKIRAAGVKVISWLTKFGFEEAKAK